MEIGGSALAFLFVEGVLEVVVAIFLLVSFQHGRGVVGTARDPFAGQQVVFQTNEGFVEGLFEGTRDQPPHESGLGAEVKFVFRS